MNLFQFYCNPALSRVVRLIGLICSHHLNSFENIQELDIVWPCPTNINVHIVITYYDMLIHGRGKCGSWDEDRYKYNLLIHYIPKECKLL